MMHYLLLPFHLTRWEKIEGWDYRFILVFFATRKVPSLYALEKKNISKSAWGPRGDADGDASAIKDPALGIQVAWTMFLW